MITHSNLADNLKLILAGLSAVDDTVVVAWLPQARNELAAGSTAVGENSLPPTLAVIYYDRVCTVPVWLVSRRVYV